MLDWNDLKYLVAVARHGSTVAAGKSLGVNQSTVQRRLTELERRIGQPLVERMPAGYRLTPFAHELLPAAEHVAASVAELERQVAAARREPQGVLRLTCPAPIVPRLTDAGVLARFQARHPGVAVEFVMSDRYVDLLQGEADVALRSGDTTDDALVGRKIADSLWAVYAAPRYVQAHGAPRDAHDLAAHPLIGFEPALARHRAALWLAEVAPTARIAARADSMLAAVGSCRAGVGIGLLPTALGDAEPALQRLFGPVPELTRAWRLLTTPALRRTPRVSAFFDFIVEEIERLRPVLTG